MDFACHMRKLGRINPKTKFIGVRSECDSLDSIKVRMSK